MKPNSHIPIATYRLQLNRHFSFADALEIVPYLARLGISHCYISPCLKARPGSVHGYDIVDHNSFNPEIGSAEDFDHFVETLHNHGMGLILDIVPNHMGVMGSDNAWWLDVLENGQSSIYANFFDIDWQPLKEELHGKVLVPVLHNHYGIVLESGELKLQFQSERGEFYISYHEHRFPVDPKEYPRILQQCGAGSSETLNDQTSELLEFQSLITAFGHLPGRQEVDSSRVAERNRDKEIHKRRLAELYARSPDIGDCLRRVVHRINGNVEDPGSFEQLHELIKAQTFRLANWRVASDDINYRRFFDTNDLAGICMESDAVFQATHRLILTLMAEGKVNGLRIDHPDGLYDPAEYFNRLQRGIAAAEKLPQADSRHYVVIEKILTGRERLPAGWPICGTTGYDFANLVNGLFVDSATVMRLERIYRRFIGDEMDIGNLLYRCRKLIMRINLASELNVIANQITKIALSRRRTCDFTLNGLRDALAEVVASFPVYRTYVSESGLSDSDAQYIRMAIVAAKRRSPAADTTIFDFLNDSLTTEIAVDQNPGYRNAVTRFSMKVQQFTSPVMAKGVEDTALYRYNRLVSLNDVGSDLHRFGTTLQEFHTANEQTLRDWPHTMLATSTHDSKRSEDVRARINVLSEIPGLWRLRVRKWRDLNRRYKRVVNDKPAPSANDEYLLYQTLVGAWPTEVLGERDDWQTFRRRIEEYMLKAIREAKQNTSWINRNAEYEAAVLSFVNALLSSDQENLFLDDFVPFQRRIARIGLWNSLSQTLLKLTCPGVPDIYQGNELWDFSLVDPDNRRPIDYARRQRLLENVRGEAPVDPLSLSQWLQNPDDGQLKLYLIAKTLALRHRQSSLFQFGQYVPLPAVGAQANHVVAFVRRHGSANAFVIAPRMVAGLVGDKEVPPIGSQIWADTSLVLPFCDCNNRYRNQFTGRTLELGREISISEALAGFPVALFGPVP